MSAERDKRMHAAMIDIINELVFQVKDLKNQIG